MLFRDFVELLYKAYLEDRGILKTLRDKLQDGSYLQDLEDDPDLQDWQEINPRAIDPRRSGRSKYHPNTPTTPRRASGSLRAFRRRTQRHSRRSRKSSKGEILKMLKIDDKRLESQIKEILQNTTYSSPEEYLIARVAADHKTIKQKRKLDR